MGAYQGGLELDDVYGSFQTKPFWDPMTYVSVEKGLDEEKGEGSKAGRMHHTVQGTFDFPCSGADLPPLQVVTNLHRPLQNYEVSPFSGAICDHS